MVTSDNRGENDLSQPELNLEHVSVVKSEMTKLLKAIVEKEFATKFSDLLSLVTKPTRFKKYPNRVVLAARGKAIKNDSRDTELNSEFMKVATIKMATRARDNSTRNYRCSALPIFSLPQ